MSLHYRLTSRGNVTQRINLDICIISFYSVKLTSSVLLPGLLYCLVPTLCLILLSPISFVHSFIHSFFHHHLRVVLTDRCAAPWPLTISVLHRDESGIALASSWTRLSQVRRGRPGGLVQLVNGFLPSWLFTINSKALFAGTSGSKCTTWRKRDRRRLRRIPLIVDKPVFWSTSTLCFNKIRDSLLLSI